MTLGLIDLDGCGDGDRSPNVYLNGAPGPWTHAVFCYVTDGPYGGGDKAIRVVGSGGQAIRLLAQASSHVCVGFHAMRWSSNNPQAGPSFELREGTTVHLKVRFNHSGDVVVYDGANVALGSCFPGATGLPPQETGLFPYRQWTPFAVEVKVADAPNGEVRIYLWGIATPFLELTGIDTRNGGTGVIDRLRWSGPDGNEIYVDDLWVVDMTVPGAVPLGVCRVADRPAAADAGGEWVPSTGTQHFAVVDEQPFSATDYLSTDLDGAIEQLAVSDDGLDFVPLGVRVIGQLARNGAGAAKARLRLQDGPGVGTGPTITLDTTPVLQVDVYAERPASAGEWDQASVDGMLIGAEKITV